jgi:hypothetical protein
MDRDNTLNTNYGLQPTPTYRFSAAATASDQVRGYLAGQATASSDESRSTVSAAGRLTLDRIVSDGRLPVPKADPAEAMLVDRQRTQQLGLDDAITQLQWRYDLYREHMDELQQTELTVLNAHHTWHDFWAIVDERRDPELRKQLETVAQQRREERLSLWRDLSWLRQAVPDWAERYLSAYRKVQLFKDGGGYA